MPLPAYSLEPGPAGLTLGRFAALAALDRAVHAVGTVRGPLVSTPPDHPDTAATLRGLARAIGLRDAAWLRQVHGATVVATNSGGFAGEGDALTTSAPGLGVVGFSADCPLLLAFGRGSEGRPAAGMAHASWRSTVRGIAGRMIASLRDDHGVAAADLTVCICPSAGPCCYEVGPEVRAEAVERIGPHAADFFPERDGGLYFDLWAAARDALERAGVPPGNIHPAGACTICGPKLYPSWRRDRTSERFPAIIGASD